MIGGFLAKLAVQPSTAGGSALGQSFPGMALHHYGRLSPLGQMNGMERPRAGDLLPEAPVGSLSVLISAPSVAMMSRYEPWPAPRRRRRVGRERQIGQFPG